MKKILVFSSLLGISLVIVGCNNKDNDTATSTNNDLNYEEICNKDEGTVQIWDEEGENIAVCSYSGSFCFIDDLLNGDCVKGDIPFYEDNYDSDLTEQSVFSECDTMEEDIVCGKDGNTYSNRCYMERSGVEEETESAKILDGKCIYE